MVLSPAVIFKYILHFISKLESLSLDEERRGAESKLVELQCEFSTKVSVSMQSCSVN